jgi:hypothetical protein
VRYGARQLRLNPLFTTVAVLSLALGIGANTAAFTLLDQLVLRLLPVQDAERLAMICYFQVCRRSESEGSVEPSYTGANELATT